VRLCVWSIPTKVGYKQAKYLTDLKVTHVLDKVGYWEDQAIHGFTACEIQFERARLQARQ